MLVIHCSIAILCLAGFIDCVPLKYSNKNEPITSNEILRDTGTAFLINFKTCLVGAEIEANMYTQVNNLSLQMLHK